jgi:hypothetical protein
MPPDEPSGTRPAAPIVIRIKLRYDDVEVMVQRFASNVGKSGLFLPTKALQPIGTELKFELRLADDTPVLVGVGKVRAATPPDPDHPRMPFGMAIELSRVTPQSRALILRMLERRRVLGLPELGLPMAADIEAARRAELTTGPVPLVPPPAPPVMAASEPAVLTAPRRTTAPMAAVHVLAFAPLAAEPPRRPRLAVSELIERAAGPGAVELPGLDEEVDVAAVIARARVLAGAGLDMELEALIAGAAVPIEASVEAASAELARQLGGAAVRRDRSARWAPPPETIAPAPEPPPETIAPAPEPPPETIAPAPEPVTPEPVAAEPVAPEPVAPAPEPVAPEPEPEPAPEPEPPAPAPAPPEPEPPEPAPAPPEPEPPEPEPLPAAPEREPTPDLVHHLSDLDLDDAEHTDVGAAPVDPIAAALADGLGLSRESSLEISIEGGVEIPDDPPADPPVEPIRREDSGLAPLDFSLDEFDDFEILAEANADDEDLLAAHAERDRLRAPGDEASGEVDDAKPARASDSDFASRLDLGDDSFDSAVDAPPLDSAGQALAAFDISDEGPDTSVQASPRTQRPGGDSRRIVQPIFDSESTGSYTLAGAPPPSDLDLGPVIRDRAAPRPTKLPPPSRGPAQLPPLYGGAVEDDELENALEALDVDLDDLAIPQAPPVVRRATPPPAARSGPHVVTDDGLEIDFEEE